MTNTTKMPTLRAIKKMADALPSPELTEAEKRQRAHDYVEKRARRETFVAELAEMVRQLRQADGNSGAFLVPLVRDSDLIVFAVAPLEGERGKLRIAHIADGAVFRFTNTDGDTLMTTIPTRQLDEMEKLCDHYVWNSQLVQSGVQIN